MSVTSTELKNNLEKYLVLSATEDVFITKNGKVIAKLTNPYQNRVETAKSLFGILPVDADMDYIITKNVKDYQGAMIK
ncbi:MAG: type II toxin-antitoxin system prevent-host-death family antitoxin, partial [Lachnospiraceae bacterium]|nr:type II toxin-antitoxin system prevent-host-death family antitoxin [Lachnospiraceae bacterium]